MSYDTPLGQSPTQFSDLPFRQQMKIQFTDMGKRSWNSAKNFGFIGLVFTGTECSIESVSFTDKEIISKSFCDVSSNIIH